MGAALILPAWLFGVVFFGGMGCLAVLAVVWIGCFGRLCNSLIVSALLIFHPAFCRIKSMELADRQQFAHSGILLIA